MIQDIEVTCYIDEAALNKCNISDSIVLNCVIDSSIDI